MSEQAHQIDGKKLEKIKRRIKIGGKHINLRRLGLTDQDLEVVLDMIYKESPKLVVLELTDNKLTSIPSSIQRFTQLKTLHLQKNEVTMLPEEMIHLGELNALYLNDNQLEDPSEVIEGLANLKELTLYGNGMKRSTRFHIRDIMQRKGNSDRTVVTIKNGNDLDPKAKRVWDDIMTLEGTGQDWKKVYLSRLQILQKGDFKSFSTFDKFKLPTHQTLHKVTFSGFEVLEDFLMHVAQHKLMHRPHYKELVYPGLREYMLQVLKGTMDEKKMALQEMATALGDCATPVRTLLVNKTIGLSAKNHQLLDPELQAILLEREALRGEVIKKLDIKGPEATEIVEGLLNSIYMKGASTQTRNKLRISRNRTRACLPSVSANPEFAFTQITEKTVKDFAKLCCKTDGDGNLERRFGFYSLDPKKLKDIKERYLYEELGIRTATTKHQDTFKKGFEELLRTADCIKLFEAICSLEGEEEERVHTLLDVDHWLKVLRDDTGECTEQKAVSVLDRARDEINALCKAYLPEKTPATKPTAAVAAGSRLSRLAHVPGNPTRSPGLRPRPSHGPQRATRSQRTAPRR